MSEEIKCLKCGEDALKLRGGTDEKVRLKILCTACGADFTLEEIAWHLYEQRLKARANVGKSRKD